MQKATRIFVALLVASVNELFAFLTLALLLQVNIVTHFIHPHLSKLVGREVYREDFLSAPFYLGEAQETYVVFALQFLLTFYLAPAVVGLVNICSDPATSAVLIHPSTQIQA